MKWPAGRLHGREGLARPGGFGQSVMRGGALISRLLGSADFEIESHFGPIAPPGRLEARAKSNRARPRAIGAATLSCRPIAIRRPNHTPLCPPPGALAGVFGEK